MPHKVIIPNKPNPKPTSRERLESAKRGKEFRKSGGRFKISPIETEKHGPLIVEPTPKPKPRLKR